MSEELADHHRQNFISQLHQLQEAGALTRHDRAQQLVSAVDAILIRKDGVAFVYEHIDEIVDAGVFTDTPWQDTGNLNSSLVGGTLKAGGMTAAFEIISELRVLAISEGKIKSDDISSDDAQKFIDELIITNLDLLFPDASEVLRNLDKVTRKHIKALFDFLQDVFIKWDRIGKLLAEELQMICSQRPIVTDRARYIIRIIRDKMTSVEHGEHETQLRFFIDALYAPSRVSRNKSVEEYELWLKQSSEKKADLIEECEALSVPLRETGLSSAYHALLVQRIKDDPELLGKALGLNTYGIAELNSHHKKIHEYISLACYPDTSRFVYGLALMLERNLLSRQPVAVGLEQLLEIEINPDISDIIKKANPESHCTAHQHLFADTICMLGQPLGVGQGWNPTCQSARGMSLWSRHDPGKLLGMIHKAATANDLEMRFEGQLLKSSDLPDGLMKQFDYNLDTVSIVLVPHLDRIYFEMMRRAAGRFEDPHKWVNPAMYGQWIPTGFSSPYSYVTNTITEYEKFMRLFYVTHHPEFNGGHDLSYPNPVGIFLTASSGKLLGFHAVSILRVARHKEEMRVYFLNPNNEGRQKWQSDIQPTVAENGEMPGESSLPFHQFASRLYAFHYIPSEDGEMNSVSDQMIEKVISIAKSSWGTSYVWPDSQKLAC